MTILTLSSVDMAFGAEPLLNGVSFSVSQAQRWGVVGRNGTGKTTLFNLMAGSLEPTGGTIVRRPGLTVALLDQHRDFGEARTVWEAAALGYRDLLELERTLTAESRRLEELGPDLTFEGARWAVTLWVKSAAAWSMARRISAVLISSGRL